MDRGTDTKLHIGTQRLQFFYELSKFTIQRPLIRDLWYSSAPRVLPEYTIKCSNNFWNDKYPLHLGFSGNFDGHITKKPYRLPIHI